MVASPSARLPEMRFEAREMWSLSFFCFLIFNVAYYSRILDLKFALLHIPLITGSIAIAGALLGGGIVYALRVKQGICIVALTVLFFANVPFSVWPGGSYHLLTGVWLKTMGAYLIAASLIDTSGRAGAAIKSVAIGTGLGSVLANALGRLEGGRLTLFAGVYSNPNQLAIAIVFCLPLITYVVLDKASNKLLRLVSLFALFSSLIAVFRTASRGGLIGLVAILLMVFLRMSVTGKLAFVVAGVAAVAGVVTVAPHSVSARYGTILSGRSQEAETVSEAGEVESAVESSEQRTQLLIDSLKTTVTHPLLGVGIGQFAVYMSYLDKSNGKYNSAWRGTHNAYTQISSEAGVPAFILFVTLLISSFRDLRSIEARAHKIPLPRAQSLFRMALAMRLSLVAFCVCVLFAHMGYDMEWPMMVGLTVGLLRAANTELPQLERQAGLAPAVAVEMARPVGGPRATGRRLPALNPVR
jgi:O-antigen ligase